LRAEESREQSGRQSQQHLVEIWETLSGEERAALRRSDEQLRETRSRLIEEEWRER
jgi:hypothetical protein